MTIENKNVEFQSEDIPYRFWISFLIWLGFAVFFAVAFSSWCVNSFFILTIIGALGTNTDIVVRISVDSQARVIRVRRTTLFGLRNKDVPFENCSGVEVSHATISTRDHKSWSLVIQTINDSFRLINSSTNLEDLNEKATRLRSIIGLLDPIPTIHKETSENFRTQLKGLCQKHFPDCEESVTRASIFKLAEAVSLPDEDIYLYVNAQLLFSGRYGLVICPSGLYWNNKPGDEDIQEYKNSRFNHLSWYDFSETEIKPDPEDGDIMIGSASQLVVEGSLEREKLLEFFTEIQMICKAEYT